MSTTTIVIPESLNNIHIYVLDLYRRFAGLPGASIVIGYIKASYKDDPLRSVFELALLLFAVKYFLSSKKQANKPTLAKLSEKEVDDLCQEWEPEPLAFPLGELEKWQLADIPVTQGSVGPHACVDARDVLNLASLDFLNFNSNAVIKAAAKQTIMKSGVGACGPPNFYGTQDYHVRAEEDLAEFLGAERAMVYGQDFNTNTSVLPSFVKRGDLCIVDSGVGVSTQNALKMSRCRVQWFNHNDMDHLEEILQELQPGLAEEKPITRRFIVSEGLFVNFGDYPDLHKLVELKEKYRYRLFLDESYSIGVLGKTGRGLPELFGIPRSSIEITTGSMALAFASSGGFCVGESDMIQHQRISSLAFVFSASLPPYCARVTSTALHLITNGDLTSEAESKIVASLNTKSESLSELFSSDRSLQPFVLVKSIPLSPVIHMRLSPKYREMLQLPPVYGGPQSAVAQAWSRGLEAEYFLDETYNLENFLLSKIVALCKSRDVLITRSKRILHHEVVSMVPELLVCVTDGVSVEELAIAFHVVKESILAVTQQVNNHTAFRRLEDEL
ncbi:hypothetical protein BABINDRAFT_167426 [Babjeviella inositovora NRRL Y-12698]|uniref:serine C-palmitoyltransferase n=1 Tax=Babjeviella inositovora NRRL Y-12698 TaxID=984486 RepID=A0A1E3QPJ2_9ASCO|nr:uncharacterized protein BABINDRAFT_167426 [Babjeviella inositovora NRRL Y-12698]ODQ79581.1 hypothetical protein BABINDRAFT_167426 [Babjeviella inositovora NRRL Y-12698]